VFPNQGSARNYGPNKISEIKLKTPNIPQNVAGIFSYQVAILELSPLKKL
jgi:hypothetical protein